MNDMSLLLVDAGNTRIKADFLHEGRLVRSFSVATDSRASDLPAAVASTDAAPSAVLLASVVRGVGEILNGPVQEKWGLDVIEIDATMPLGIRIDVPRPEAVGIDRLLMAGEAFARSGKGVIVVGVGTAITVDVVTPDGVYVGGAISAGIRTSAWALAKRTSLLPEVDFEQDVVGIPKSTPDAIRTGILLGAAGSIDRQIERFAESAGMSAVEVILTGGDSTVIGPYLLVKHRVTGDLLAWGMAHTFDRIQNR